MNNIEDIIKLLLEEEDDEQKKIKLTILYYILSHKEFIDFLKE